jgi:hypothetical protein
MPQSRHGSRRRGRHLVDPERREHLPGPREIMQGLYLPFPVAHNIWRFMHASVATASYDDFDVLERIAAYLRRVFPDDWGDVRVERLQVQRYNEWGEAPTEDVGYVLDQNGDRDSTALVYLDGSYKLWKWNEKKKEGKWVPGPKGYYLTSQQSVEEAWVEYVEGTMHTRDWEEEGPREDNLWTDDARTFYAYRHGESKHDSGHRRGHDHVVFEINAPIPSDKLLLWMEKLDEKIEELEGIERETDEEIEADEREIRRLQALRQRVRARYDAITDDWPGSEEALDEMSRPGVWFAIEKLNDRGGYIWFRRRSRYGHRGDTDWRIVEAPSKQPWKRDQPWRKDARRARELVRRYGARPQKGDLFTVGPAPYGIAFDVYGEPEAAPFVITRAEIAAGQAVETLKEEVARRSQRLARPVSVWKGEPFSSPLSWQRVYTLDALDDEYGVPSPSRPRVMERDHDPLHVGPTPPRWIRR